MITAKKQDRLLRESTAVARKVFVAVPIQEVWDVSQVCTELGRLGIMPPRHVVHGCLSALVRSGLVREPEKNCYIREAVRPAEDPTEDEEDLMTFAPPAAPTAPTTATPFDRMANVATDLRAQADRLLAAAEAIDNLALEMHDQIENGSAEFRELRQKWETLQSLFGHRP